MFHARDKNKENHYSWIRSNQKKIRREISGGVFRAIFGLRSHLVVDIHNFEPFFTRLTDMDATVKLIIGTFLVNMRLVGKGSSNC